MAKAKKLPSGNWRVKAYDNEAKKYKSFTAETKKKAELMALEWVNGKAEKPKTDKTVGECVAEYIDSKENLLSPSSIRGYIIIKNNAIDSIKDISAAALTEKDLQFWVSSNARRYKPKSIKTQYGLVTAALRQNKINLDFKDVLLPRIERNECSLLPCSVSLTISAKKTICHALRCTSRGTAMPV